MEQNNSTKIIQRYQRVSGKNRLPMYLHCAGSSVFTPANPIVTAEEIEMISAAKARYPNMIQTNCLRVKNSETL
jgi:hypothetical protein